MGRKRRKFADNFTASVALEALRGDRTIQKIAARYNVLPTQVGAWKKKAVEGMADVFSKGGGNDDREAEVKELHAKIGRLTVENDFLAKGLKQRENIKTKTMELRRSQHAQSVA